ncbi:MAG: hypothetical protein LIP00_07485 [Parabacteroides sp.]|nr:hypothetical protein [Parabacteroides sp.]
MAQTNINKVLTILFLLLAAAAVACYFLIPDKTAFFIAEEQPFVSG